MKNIMIWAVHCVSNEKNKETIQQSKWQRLGGTEEKKVSPQN